MRLIITRLTIFFRWLFFSWARGERERLIEQLCEAAPEAESVEHLSIRWQFKEGILDRLDEYFCCARRMRRFDRDSYDLFSRIGFSIPADAYAADQTLRALRPPRAAFGGILFGRSNCEQWHGDVSPSFLYFRKIDHPVGVEAAIKGAEVYRFVVLWDERRAAEQWRSVLTVPVHFHVAVSERGEVTLLKELVSLHEWIRPKRGERFRMNSRVWDYPKVLKGIASDEGLDIRKWANDLFRITYLSTAWVRNEWLIRVRAPDGAVAAFGIGENRAVSFFPDRDRAPKALTPRGRLRPIFHNTRAHPRSNLKHVEEVRAYQSGLRHFSWNGYEVNIVKPQNNDLLDCPLAAKDESAIEAKDRARFYDSKTVGKKFDRALSA